MTRITGAVRRDDTIQRLGGNGDNWYPTWGADGSLYVALCDGTGFDGMPRRNYNSRLVRVDGRPETGLTFHDVPGYPDLSYPIRGEFEEGTPGTRLGIRYYGFGTLSVDGTIYQYLNTWPVPLTEEVVAGNGELKFIGAKLIYSPDGGTTWHNQDGSTPVQWEDWDERSADTMVFWNEPGESFGVRGILQMGQDYSANTDGYVYGYAPNGGTEGTMNQLVMFRVPKGSVTDRSAYEFFVSANADGSATWTPDLLKRGVVHTFPSGWVNRFMHPYAWMPSVTYNEALGLYLMANWATGVGEDGFWFGKPSYLGMWSSTTPWGPWEQFYENESWTPEGDQNAVCYSSVILPAWVAEDGRSFWLMWTDFQSTFSAEEKEHWGPIVPEAIKSGDHKTLAQYVGTGQPYYSINLQRVDLEVS